MSQDNPILVIEDDAALRDAIVDTLNMANFPVVSADCAESALELLEKATYRLIISDVQMPGKDGHGLLQYCRQNHPHIPFILITAYGNTPQAVEAIRDGAADYIIKPFEAEILIEAVDRLAIQEVDNSELVVSDKTSLQLTELALRVASTDVSVMICGESGCGKEVYARFIHQHSDRKKEPFIAINCAAIPESMLESMLFGYEKGAFTGAYNSRAGKFEQANNGTLLLDEISEMDLGLQAKLLRVLQEKEVERLGSNKTTPLNVRILATTNRNLKQEVKAGRFREDLFYRLNVFPLKINPLRERKSDILPLARKFITDYQPGQGIQINPGSIEKLVNHTWPGNVRELQNVIQRALVLKKGALISEADLILESEEIHADHVDKGAIIYSSTTSEEANSTVLETDLKTREKEIIMDALAQNSSRKETAEKLGISQRTLRYKLAKFRKEGVSIPCMPTSARAM